MIDAVNKCSALGFVSSLVRGVCKWYIHLAEDHHSTNYTVSYTRSWGLCCYIMSNMKLVNKQLIMK